MRLRVIADSEEDFDAWVANQQEEAAAATGDAADGAELFVAKGCSGCHTINGLEGANGKVGPNLTHLSSRGHFAGAIFELNEKNLTRWLRDPPKMKPMAPANGQGMPNLGLTDEEITKLIAYLETLK
jgi:cytochrome c oxidase subunit 2